MHRKQILMSRKDFGQAQVALDPACPVPRIPIYRGFYWEPAPIFGGFV